MGKTKLLLGVGAAIVVILAALSAIDLPRRTYTGFSMDGTHKVIAVEMGSPAARADVRVGDILKSVNGVLISNSKGMEQVYLVGIGLPSGIYRFERGAQTVQVEIQRGPFSARQIGLALIPILVGLALVGLPLRAYFTAPGKPATLLGVSGLAFGATIVGTPPFQSPTINIILFNTMWLSALLGGATLLHFLLTFPWAAPVLRRWWGMALLYAPAFGVALTVDRSMRIIFFGLSLLAIYLVIGVAVVLWRYGRASSHTRTAHGLRLIVATAVMVSALLPAYLILVRMWPTIGLPWESFALVVVVLLPIGLCRAVVRSAGATSEADAIENRPNLQPAAAAGR